MTDCMATRSPCGSEFILGGIPTKDVSDDVDVSAAPASRE
jgi:hypothetical protein